MKKKNHFSIPCCIDQIPQNIEPTSGYCHLERILKTYEFPQERQIKKIRCLDKFTNEQLTEVVDIFSLEKRL